MAKFKDDELSIDFNDPKLMKPKDTWYTTAGSTDPFEDHGENMEQAKIDAAEDVQFGDRKLMGADVQDDIINFIAGYPYTNFQWICRRLNVAPAKALKQILPNITLVENCCWTPAQVKLNLIGDVESLTEKGWTPGVRPPEPPTPEALRQMIWDHFKPELEMLMDESIADLVYRSGSDIRTVVAFMVDIAVGCTLRRFKKLSLDPGAYEFTWLLSPLELAEAAASCEWITGAREDAAKEKEGK